MNNFNMEISMHEMYKANQFHPRPHTHTYFGIILEDFSEIGMILSGRLKMIGNIDKYFDSDLPELERLMLLSQQSPEIKIHTI